MKYSGRVICQVAVTICKSRWPMCGLLLLIRSTKLMRSSAMPHTSGYSKVLTLAGPYAFTIPHPSQCTCLLAITTVLHIMLIILYVK